jgi:hypothetical protein
VQSPCNPLIEDYTEIFYKIDEEDGPFSEYKMSLRRPKSMRKVDDLSLTLIGFYAPALSPCHNSTETSPQLSENITLFAVACIQVSSTSLTCPAGHLGTDRTENTVPLLQCNCCVRVCWGSHVIATQPLSSSGRCLQSHYLAAAVV